MTLSRKLVAEFIGTAGLLAVVIGSGIMGENLAGGNAAIALLANAIATGAGLAFLILSFGNISGAHFNPAVTLTEAFRGNISWKEGAFYVVTQITGAFVGVGIANLMFGFPVFFASTKVRAGGAQFLSEFVATFGLIAVIQAGVKFHPKQVAWMVATYITAAYWFTASTSFANPAVTVARSFTNTFSGIAPSNMPAFIIAQIVGALLAVSLLGWLFSMPPHDDKVSADRVADAK
jgi:glycerol uptake facilitator-like aquaporin